MEYNVRLDAVMMDSMWNRFAIIDVVFVVLVYLLACGVFPPPAMGNHDAKRLYDDLLKKHRYNKLVRPVGNTSDCLVVRLGLRLSQILDVDEKNQIMTTNVWLIHEWSDSKLRWNPEEYGGVDRLYVPADELWIPDIVLYNNADGNFTVSLRTKATLSPNGLVKWEPPAIYKSFCEMDVEFFPFDIQHCSMKFGSWTYDGYAVDLQHIEFKPSHDPAQDKVRELKVFKKGIDMADFYRSVEWDLLEIPAKKSLKFYTCCDVPYPDIRFNITLRRKTLFYTVNLIIPCVAISGLTVLVFYLPSDSGEKITMSISILVSLTMFFLLLAEINPPTSLVVPLIGKYLLFTMMLLTLSIMITVIVLNVHFRSPSTHEMSPWVRKVFLNILPRLLLMRRPSSESDFSHKVVVRTLNGIEVRDSYSQGTFDNILDGGLSFDLGYRNFNTDISSEFLAGETLPERRPSYVPPKINKAFEGVAFIAKNIKDGDQDKKTREDWKYVALVIDRLFLWVFTTACIVGTCGIILQAPTLYDDRLPIAGTED